MKSLISDIDEANSNMDKVDKKADNVQKDLNICSLKVSKIQTDIKSWRKMTETDGMIDKDLIDNFVGTEKSKYDDVVALLDKIILDPDYQISSNPV